MSAARSVAVRSARIALVSLGLAVPVVQARCAAQQQAAAELDGWQHRPLLRPQVPAVRDTAWVRGPIDAFVLHRLEAAGLAPAPAADRVELLRRATYDLTGLPPTPAEIAAFTADTAPDAWERTLERLLASPQYGVHQARHWLDLVRFAETDSYERDRLKPGAWRYRDWVVDAINDNVPFDRFLVEQLAGDELEDATLSTWIATGYYRLGIWDDEPTDTLQAVYDDLDGIVDTTSRVMLGMSMGCARCHDHKKDPIPQRDYYRLLAVFEHIKPYKVGGGNAPTPANYLRSIPADLGSDAFAHRERAWREQREELLREVRNLAHEAWSRLADAERAAIADERGRGLVAHLPFDGDDATCGSTGATATGTSLVDDGRVGAARRFDGRGDRVVVPRAVTDDFTLALWFRAERPGRGSADDLRWFTGSGLVDAEVAGIVDDFGLSLVADHVAAGTGRPETFVASGGGLADGGWHHVAFTRTRSTGELALYVDGVAVAHAKGGTQALTAPESVSIGRLLPGNGGFRGALDDVRIYDRALDARAVLDLFAGGGFERATSDAVRRGIGEPELLRYEAAVERLLALRRPQRDMVEVLCVQEPASPPAPSFVRVRGNVHAKGEAVEPGVPAVLGGAPLHATPTRGETSGRRLAFARWLVRRDNPATWRVAANRLWQYHFGRGIVRTPNDFGRLGELPTHPELCDWLAAEFVARDFDVKAMHRLIMTSSTYRMAARTDPATTARALRIDPLNDLLWRFDMRRLAAEEIRDSILAVNGTLNLEMAGPGVYPAMPAEVLATSSRPDEAWGKSSPEQAARRSIYIHAKRSLLSPLLLAFDLADTDASCPVRFATTQPTQALTMLNSDFITEQAALLGKRLRREAGTTRERIELGLRLVTQRAPATADVEELLRLAGDLERVHGLPPEPALDRVALVLLNLNEFVYLD